MDDLLASMRESLVRIEAGVGAVNPASASQLNIVEALPLYTPASAGAYHDVARLTLQSANQLFPFIARLAHQCGASPLQHYRLDELLHDPDEKAAAQQLASLFEHYGSDKSKPHNYHLLYANVLSRPDRIQNVLEIGLGTNNADIVSNMGGGGRPGASLRAFRDFLQNARIYGADIDQRILFAEERIETFFVDQTDSSAFEQLGSRLPAEFDLIIDDGLHSPNANVNTLSFALPRLKAGGWAIIEDIHPASIPVWEVVAFLIKHDFLPVLFHARHSLVFGAKRPNVGYAG